MTARIRIEYIGGGQYNLTNGKNDHNIRLDLGIVPICESFGMKLRHKNGCTDRSSTDGTVRCDNCGQTTDRFYCQAWAYLQNLAETGRTVADPGYFSEEN